VAQRTFYIVGTGSLSGGVKGLVCGVDRIPPLIAEVKERLELYPYFHFGLYGLFLE